MNSYASRNMHDSKPRLAHDVNIIVMKMPGDSLGHIHVSGLNTNNAAFSMQSGGNPCIKDSCDGSMDLDRMLLLPH